MIKLVIRSEIWANQRSATECMISTRCRISNTVLILLTCITDIFPLHVILHALFKLLFLTFLTLLSTIISLFLPLFFFSSFSPPLSTQILSPLLQKLWRNPFQTQTLSSHYLLSMLSTCPQRPRTLTACPLGHLSMKCLVGLFCCIFSFL